MNGEQEVKADNPNEIRFQIIKDMLDEFPELRERVKRHLQQTKLKE